MRLRLVAVSMRDSTAFWRARASRSLPSSFWMSSS
jgi:hypothetical protein